MRLAFAITQSSVVSLVASAHDLLQHCIASRTEDDHIYAVSCDDKSSLDHRFGFIDQPDEGMDLQPDWVFVPALNIPEAGLPAHSRELSCWLRRVSDKGANVVAVGTGTFIVAEAGLFRSGKAVTHSQFTSQFEHSYPDLELIQKPTWIKDGSVLCSGELPWQEAVLAMIANCWGDDIAKDCAETYALQWNHDIYKPCSEAMIDGSISLAQRWLSEHYAEEHVILRCIERLNMHRRTFNRRFKTETGMAPLDYVLLLRVKTSQFLLATTRHSVEEIGRQVGYSDTGAFYRIFRRYTGVSPGQFRRSKVFT
ncbi:helix-turn-helix domain-containing protein [Parahaliea sp. F7430]|uniref:Helix-turn-helix domain-containing protein n=1 Tax=Sediminihaliea albiluteola TaxID=2758564 RepID=A0A7W2YKT8_9GAMM|nr:helix-turn-helix domain-containing protein [Sediminihaliea albiluteola]MBA6413703.1 helix-turn-helix domain-containing protein [Sediminihaliea albiluteola]